jgi:anaerobic magnesium-protoporphyrin IX monomethyl ester cyclase
MNNELDLLLIYPALNLDVYKKYFESLKLEKDLPRQIAPHIGISYILAMAQKNGINARFINMFAESISMDVLFKYISKVQPKVIGFTGYTTQVMESATIAKMIKEKFPNILTCIGGPHATAMPMGILKEFDSFDFVVSGEAEETIVKLFNNNLKMDDIPNIVTRTKNTYFTPRIKNLDDLPFPAWDKFDLRLYPGDSPHMTRLELPMSTSRGCFGTCTFCARPFGRKRIARSVDSVIAELERNMVDFGCQAINFDDETFLDNDTISDSVELFEKMISKGLNKKIKWACEFRVDICEPSIFKLMRRAGCYYAFFGVESADSTIRRNIGKIYDDEQIRNTITTVRDAGIICAASFILGLPGETEETAWKSIRMAKELDIYSTTFPIAVPFPGTALRQQAEKHQHGLKILTNDWSLYGKQYPGVMDSDKLSIDQLRQLQKDAYEYNPKKDMLTYMDSKYEIISSNMFEK